MPINARLNRLQTARSGFLISIKLLHKIKSNSSGFIQVFCSFFTRLLRIFMSYLDFRKVFLFSFTEIN